MPKRILLFYKYVPIENVQETLNWMKAICQALNLKGRVILAMEGINATLGGSIEATTLYTHILDAHPLFRGIDFKDSIESDEYEYFPRLRIVIKDEIVRMGISPVVVSAQDAGDHLTPAQAHKILSEKNENLVILDGRNAYESKIGHFEGAVLPDVQYFRQFPEYVDANLEKFRDKDVFMYCTGGIRCERASAYLKLKGVAKKVYQLKGGIHRYVEKYPQGFFRGRNYVFDDRIEVRVNDDVLASCELCNVSYDTYANCLNASCNKHFICCPPCKQDYAETCSRECQQLVAAGKVPVRTKLRIAQRSFCVVK